MPALDRLPARERGPVSAFEGPRAAEMPGRCRAVRIVFSISSASDRHARTGRATQQDARE